MTDTTVRQVRQRILDISSQSGIIAFVSDGVECKLTSDQLPALVVAPDGAPERSYTNKQSRLITREYRMLMLVAQICSDKETEQLAVLEQVWDIIDALPDYFARKANRLELAINGLPVSLENVHSTGHMSDSGPQYISWGAEVYSCALYRLPVIIQRA